MKKNILKFLAVILLLSCFGLTVYADGDDEPVQPVQQYTVTVVGGDYGTVNGSSSDSKTYPYQGMCYINNDFTVSNVDPKYDFIGFHISGHPEVNVANFSVDKDITIVASYAVKGSTIKYTVFYEDADGNPMSSYTDADGKPVPVSVELTGPANDDIVVPAMYIEGFWPEGYNYRLTKDNPVKEVHIKYHPNSELVGPTITETIYDGTTVIYEEGGAGGTGGGAGGGGTAPVTPVGPQEEIVIPEPEVPETQPSEPDNTQPSGGEENIEPEPVPTSSFWDTLLHNPWLLGGSIGGISLLLLFLFLLFGKKRRNEE